MVDFPEKTGMYLGVLEISHGEIFLGGPVSGVGDVEMVGGALNRRLLNELHAKLREGVGLPVEFPLPAVVGDHDFELFIPGKLALFFDALIMEVCDVVEGLGLVTVVCHGMPGADHREIIVELPGGGRGDTGLFIFSVKGEKTAKFISLVGMGEILHPIAGSSDDEFVSVAFIRPVKTGEVHAEEGEAFRNGLLYQVLLMERERREMEKLQILAVGDGEPDVDLIFVNVDVLHERLLS